MNFKGNLYFIKLHILPKSFHEEIIKICKLILQWKIGMWLLEKNLHCYEKMCI